MGVNPSRADDRKKLDDATSRSYKDMDFARRMRIRYLKAYQPSELQVAGCDSEIIVPTLYQAVETDVFELAAQNPRVTVESEFDHLKAHARRRGLVINQRIKEIDFADKLRACLYDAEFMMGILEVHNGESYPLDFGDYGSYDPGVATITPLPFDDYFYDSSVRRYCDRRFEGKYFRADYEALMNDPNIEKKAKDALGNSKVLTAEVNRSDASARAGVDAQGEGATADLLTPAVELKTVYLCHEKLVVTMVAEKPDLPPIRVTPWKFRTGPFQVLQLGFMPDQVMGICPASVGYVLHNLVNLVWKKRREQAASQKNVTGYQGASVADAQNLKDARNNEFIKLAHLDKIKMFSTMGPDAALGQYGLEALSMLDRSFNNLPARAGLGPSTDTVGQDQMILGAVTAMQAKKSNNVLAFVAKVVGLLGELLDEDKFYERDLFYEAPQKSMRLPYPWRPGKRPGQPDQFLERVEPYSMMYVNPSAKFKGVTDYLVNIRAILSQTPGVNLGEVDAMAAEYLDEPRLLSLVEPISSAMDPNNYANDMGVLDVKGIPKPGKPNGEYTRRNERAPGSDDYASKQLQAALVSGKPQQMNGSLPTGVKQL
jgi:hypothetical protein